MPSQTQTQTRRSPWGPSSDLSRAGGVQEKGEWGSQDGTESESIDGRNEGDRIESYSARVPTRIKRALKDLEANFGGRQQDFLAAVVSAMTRERGQEHALPLHPEVRDHVSALKAMLRTLEARISEMGVSVSGELSDCEMAYTQAAETLEAERAQTLREAVTFQNLNENTFAQLKESQQNFVEILKKEAEHKQELDEARDLIRTLRQSLSETQERLASALTHKEKWEAAKKQVSDLETQVRELLYKREDLEVKVIRSQEEITSLRNQLASSDVVHRREFAALDSEYLAKGEHHKAQIARMEEEMTRLRVLASPKSGGDVQSERQ